MTTEVYLLSIPFARHRSIVPRRRDTGIAIAGSYVRPLEQRVSDTTDRVAISPLRSSALQRIDSR
jgi:hypothetical protein